MMVWMSVTMQKDQVHNEFGRYILCRFGGSGGTFVYPSRARKPRLKDGSKVPPSREARELWE